MRKPSSATICFRFTSGIDAHAAADLIAKKLPAVKFSIRFTQGGYLLKTDTRCFAIAAELVKVIYRAPKSQEVA